MGNVSNSTSGYDSSASDSGAVAARQGFKYQDHIAAELILLMLDDPHLVQVECETSDDITLVWENNGVRCPEYVQVKTTEGDKKWSITEVCKREGDKSGTSLLEKSLLCDQHGQGCKFRIVSRRAIAQTLDCLSVSINERVNDPKVKSLCKSFSTKLKTTSNKGTTVTYWTENLLWQVRGTVDGIEAQNILSILQLAESQGVNPNHSYAKEIYRDLLAKATDAAEASRKTEPNRKVITREHLLDWWENHLNQTDAAQMKNSKPYRINMEKFLVEIHHLSEENIRRVLTGYDAQYEQQKWRSAQLADYLMDWLPEVTLKASELVQVQHLNLRYKFQKAVKKVRKYHSVDTQDLLAEILLHAVLRQRFESEPIACKIFYKDHADNNMAGQAHIIHNFDADELWMGRATLTRATSYESVLSILVREVELSIDTDLLKEEREVILALREPQHLKATTLNKALAKHSPIDELLKVLCVPIMIGYDSAVLSKGFDENYREPLREELIDQYESLKSRLPSNVQQIKIHVFLVPIECVDTLIRQFGEKIQSVG